MKFLYVLKKNVQVVAICTAVAFSILFYLLGDEYLIALQALITLIFCIITFNKFLLSLLSKFIEHVFPVKLLLGIIGVCFLLLGFIISFHTDVFTSHDHYNDSKAINGSKRNGYEWFNLSHVYRFPIEQLVPDVATIQANKFDIKRGKETEHSYLFIIDKTESTEESPSIAKLSEVIKNSYKDLIYQSNNEAPDLYDDFLNISDFILLYNICALNQHNLKGNFRVGIYWGNENQKIDYINEYEQINHKSIKNIIKLYHENVTIHKEALKKRAKNLKGYNEKSQRITVSRYDTLISSVYNYGIRDTSNNIVENNCLTIIGDFYHETNVKDLENDYKKIAKTLLQLNNNKISQVNLINLPINYSRIPRGTDIVNINKIPTHITNLFKQVFERELLYNKINFSNIFRKKDSIAYFNSQIIPPNLNLGEESEISVYFPYISSHSMDNSEATIKFLNKDKNFSGRILVSLKSYDANAVIGDLKINKIYPLKVDETQEVTLVSGESMYLKFNSKSDQLNGYYIDFYFPDKDRARITAPVVFREKLTKTASLCLIFVYTLLYACMALLIFIFGVALFTASDKIKYILFRGKEHYLVQIFGFLLMTFSFTIFLFSFFPALFEIVAIPGFFKSILCLQLAIALVAPAIYILLIFIIRKKDINTSISNLQIV